MATRGETVHYCLEQKMLIDDIDMGEYEEWYPIV